MTVSQYSVLGSTPGLQLHHNISDVVVVACKAAQEVNAKGACRPLYVHGDSVNALALCFNQSDLLQKVLDCQNFIFCTSRSPGANGCYVFQIIPGRIKRTMMRNSCKLERNTSRRNVPLCFPVGGGLLVGSQRSAPK